MKENVGKIDSYLRITGGLTILGIGISRNSNLLIGLGSMKVAEGITKFCPILHLLGKSTKDDGITLNFSKNFTNDVGEDEAFDS